MSKPKMPAANKSGNKLRTKDMIQGSGKAQKHPFSQGFQGDSDNAGKRKIRKTK